MEATINTIIPKYGLGKIKFGMGTEELLDILNNPDDIEQIEFEEGVFGENWHYDKLGLSFLFEPFDELQISSVSVSEKDFLFDGKSLIGKTKPEILEFLTKMFPELDLSPELEEGDELILVNEEGLYFWFEDDKLSEIQWEVLPDENGEPCWPD